eukprot:scaffold683_cov164-Amphora_coffeaeformis.AAC.4
MPSLSTAHVAVLAAACFLGTTVYAFSLLFAVAIMPGLDSLEDDQAYLQAFQAIDSTIQNNQPLFILSWVGSMLTALALAVLTTRKSACHGLSTRRRTWMVVSCIIFLVGHVITVAQNIPRNNALHALMINEASEDTLASMRQDFAGPWCTWNSLRTVLFGVASIYWLIELALLTSQEAVHAKDASFENPPEVESRFTRVV